MNALPFGLIPAGMELQGSKNSCVESEQGGSEHASCKDVISQEEAHDASSQSVEIRLLRNCRG